MDKRIERTQANVRQAAIEVLGRGGYAAFNMEAVAAAAGIAKSTLYRHWPTRIALISDALETLNRQPPQLAPLQKGELRDRVLELMRHLAEALSRSRFSKCIPALIEAAERHPEVAKFLHDYSARRREALVDAIRQGIANGELRKDFDPELAALALSGPIFYRRCMSPRAFSPAEIPDLVDLILRSGRPN
jgi:TetR/AcrR family transcriptional regulator, regulator of autoinduction and epiphytic fitness